MNRNMAIFVIGLAAIANLNAGYIQIGGNTGLTSTNSNGTITLTGGAGSGESTYNGSIWAGTGGPTSEASGNLCAGATIGTCSATSGAPAGEPNNEFATADGVTFSMINQAVGNTGENVWAAAIDGTSTITIPVGVFGVTNAFTMINDQYGVANTSPTTVTFDFLNSADDLTFTLVNGTVIRDTFDCTGPAESAALTTCVTANFATSLDTTDMYGTNGSLIGPIASTITPNVTAFNVWTGTYTLGNVGPVDYRNTTGSLFLDAQDFYLGTAAASDTLESIVITDTAGAGAGVSRDGLSAVTVQTTSAPEPSTIFLLAAGIGAAGLIRRRRSRQQFQQR